MLESLLPPVVVAVETFDDRPGEEPFPGEEDLIANAVDGRRREFMTARRCAREALQKLGYAPAPIRSGSKREPLWPAGIVGAITHCKGYRAAAVTNAADLASLGIDAEPHGALPDGVLESVVAEGDAAHLAGLTAGDPGKHWDRLLFSAKESVYKAWYPLTGRWLGFEDASLRIDPAAGTFDARIHIDGTRHDGGPPLTALSGRFLIASGLVITAIVLPHSG